VKQRSLGTVRRIALMGTMAAVAATIGCGGGPAAAPTSYADFNSNGGTFACKYPEGWDEKAGGQRGLEWAKFTSGSAEIRIDAGAAGSLMGAIAKNIGHMDPDAANPEQTPVHAVHADGVKEAQKNFSGYKEVGDPVPFDAPLGPAERSEFTASTTFGSGLHGYRATVLGHDKSVYVTCVCPESDWKTLEPAFDTVLKSLHRGQAQ
jgi:hypothetical protein